MTGMKSGMITAVGRIDVDGVFNGADAEDGVFTAGSGAVSKYPAFNSGPHICLKVKGHATLSVLLPSGKTVSIAFVPANGEEHECADINVKGCAEHDNQDGRMLPKHRLIAFKGGRDKGHQEATITAILLNPEHYKETA